MEPTTSAARINNVWDTQAGRMNSLYNHTQVIVSGAVAVMQVFNHAASSWSRSADDDELPTHRSRLVSTIFLKINYQRRERWGFNQAHVRSLATVVVSAPLTPHLAKGQRIIDATKMFLDIAKESADAFPPLKSCLGGITALIKHYEVRSYRAVLLLR